MKFSVFLIAFLHLSFVTFGQAINTTEKRDTVFSASLNEHREISVYLPPSYYSNNQAFPVLYILDGDYNFKYVSGLLELQSSISEDIPEIILVGISGGGTAHYRNNCKPNIAGIEDAGNADQMLNFIQKELVPFVDNNYKTSAYKILSGHSIGGLFVINAAINTPNFFNNYIAISPALWWENNAINQITKEKINSDFHTNTYVSLADEKGMGVDSFLQVATGSILKNNLLVFGIGILSILLALFWFFKTRKKLLPTVLVLLGILVSAYLYFCYVPTDKSFKFKQFPNENHNSVGLPTYIWALNDIFKTWDVTQQYFNSADELNAHHQAVIDQYESAFNMQNGALAYTVYTLQDNPAELNKFQSALQKNYPNSVPIFNVQWANRLIKNEKNVEAQELLEQTSKEFPTYHDSYNALAKIELENDRLNIADSLINIALQLAAQQQLRQWQINELIETKMNINKELSN